MTSPLLKIQQSPGGETGEPVRLVCIPYAGGSVAAFSGWANILGSGFQVVAVQLPGRAERWREPVFTTVAEAVEALLRSLLPVFGALPAPAPFAIFGYSAGAVTAFELARALRDSGANPLRLFVAAHGAPHLAQTKSQLHRLADPVLVEEITQRYEPLSPLVTKDPEALRLFLPVLRADLAMVERHRSPTAEPLAFPISALGGLEDNSVLPGELEAWNIHTSGGFNLRHFPGRHFFLNSSRQALLDAIKMDLREHLDLFEDART